ncbi:glutamate mutase [Nocardioides zeae]|uniref:Glutamate mutase n=1 Tax=Nocardioides zeae TaxID=1457234 RepID=A0A6P0HKQ2_9ACTN|nr:glutamate mutase [Nocardioides zeae]
MSLAVCVDLGSTFTKALLVALEDGAAGPAGTVLASASHPTTLPDAAGRGDLLDGYDACRAALAASYPCGSGADDVVVLACSSAGGGLRIGVLGNEALVTAEAGRRVALSSGGRVVAVHALAQDGTDPGALAAARPDVVLLTGGTDGGNPTPLVEGARVLAALARQGWDGAVVVAGNVDAAPAAAAVLEEAGLAHRTAGNVVPRIGVLAPASARARVRELFLAHVIGGRRLSRRPELPRLLRGATPDLVLDGVALLADVVGDVVVVDVGGATTDVYSATEVDPEHASREVVARTRLNRTVEGDLGMRWSAPSTVAAADDPGVAHDPALVAAAQRRADDPALLPATPEDQAVDLRIAEVAVRTAVRRHAGRFVDRDRDRTDGGGTDLREVALLLGSGGVLRHAGTDRSRAVLRAATGDAGAGPGGWLVPAAPRTGLDGSYVLAAVGLLAADHPEVARSLVRSLAAGAAT